VHLVHQNAAGKLAVVAVLVEEGEGSIFLDQLFRYLPAEQGKEVAPDKVQVDASALLPDTRAYYTFTGSLTTPPCTEDVTWFVLKTAVEASKEEIDAFAAKYPHNARPVQPVNGRVIQETN
jgi:carbonic anhydrase